MKRRCSTRTPHAALAVRSGISLQRLRQALCEVGARLRACLCISAPPLSANPAFAEVAREVLMNPPMKTRIASMLAAAMTITAATAFANETLPEKGKAATKDVARKGRKTMHHAEEKLCTGTKAECAKKKVEHRLNEGTDAVKDEADQLKNKVD